jgi:hypothetical protein
LLSIADISMAWLQGNKCPNSKKTTAGVQVESCSGYSFLISDIDTFKQNGSSYNLYTFVRLLAIIYNVDHSKLVQC